MKAKSFAAKAADKPLEYYEFDRREPTANDVELKIKYSGVCYSDIHSARGDWGDVDYPCVPGHEIIGTVTCVGSEVTKHEVGDTVAVGTFVNSCGKCRACKSGQEQYCDLDPVWTYGHKDPIDGTTTKGGYSDIIVVHENFVVQVPKQLDITKAAPLLCAGVTLYSPLKHWKVGPGMRVGIIGLGGLGHMGIKFAKAMGAHVTAITSSPEKTEAAKEYRADEVLVSNDQKAMQNAHRNLDLLIDTIPVTHSLEPYMDLLDVEGTIVLVGPIADLPAYHGLDVINGRRSIAGSGVGSIKETIEMLDFCVKHGILPDVEHIKIQNINNAWDNLVSKQMSKRYVIDIEKSFPK